MKAGRGMFEQIRPRPHPPVVRPLICYFSASLSTSRAFLLLATARHPQLRVDIHIPAAPFLVHTPAGS